MGMADIQLPYNNNNHRGELVQPSLVMNHNHINSGCLGERDVHGNFIKKQRLCVGCGGQILDQYILRVSPDLEWHSACLKCQECRQFLDESCTCFVRDGKTYCKRDYVRLFGTKCDKCNSSFSKNDFVMRARSKIYHIECFRCSACTKQLKPGDEFALRDGGVLYCKEDHDALEQSLQGTQHIKIEQNENNASTSNECSVKDILPISASNNSSEFGSMSDSESESDSYKSARGKFSGSVNGKPTRVRTVLNEKQLHMLRTCYNANPRPDALIKEKLVEMTGLSPRVVRVWFQNKRCKDKKKTIQMKLQMQQEKEGKLGYMKGVPLVASSPVRHDSPLNLNGLEVTKYQPPWKALADFALNSDLDNNNFNTQTPAFQHLVNQLHGYEMNDYHNPHNQMHGYMHMDNSGGVNHPDSTDSYETYLESEESV